MGDTDDIFSLVVSTLRSFGMLVVSGEGERGEEETNDKGIDLRGHDLSGGRAVMRNNFLGLAVVEIVGVVEGREIAMTG